MSAQRIGTGDAESTSQELSQVPEPTGSLFDAPGNSESVNLSSVCSGLENPSTSKDGNSKDTDAGGATSSHDVPLQRDLVTSGTRNDQIKFTLVRRERWEEFFRHDNEMLMRTNGCFLAPCLKFTISGLDKPKSYNVYLEFPMRDDYRWAYSDWTWIKEKKVNFEARVPIVKHWQSPSRGAYWMSRTVDFDSTKIYPSSVTDNPNLVCLNAFHAYVLRISVIEVDKSREPITETRVRFSFPETAFIAVTSYKNPQIRKLKRT